MMIQCHAIPGADHTHPTAADARHCWQLVQDTKIIESEE